MNVSFARVASRVALPAYASLKTVAVALLGAALALWIKLPLVAPGTDKNLVYVYAGNDKAATEAPAPVADGGAVATLRFASGAVGALLGIEGAHALGRDIDRL